MCASLSLTQVGFKGEAIVDKLIKQRKKIPASIDGEMFTESAIV